MSRVRWDYKNTSAAQRAIGFAGIAAFAFLFSIMVIILVHYTGFSHETAVWTLAFALGLEVARRIWNRRSPWAPQEEDN